MAARGGATDPVTGAYAPIHGLGLYHEVRGAGPPLVLLHGGLHTIELSFGPIVPALADRHQVIGVELQGHGHTGDVDRPMELASLADDVLALLEHLGVEGADVFGFSLGGMVALTMALRRPDRVRRLVVASVDHRPDHAEMRPPRSVEEARRQPTAADFQAMRDAYDRVAPDPGRFEAVAAKTQAMVAGAEGWTDAELRSVRAPTLVLVGDTDFVPLRHAVEMAETIPDARLAVLPDTTHVGVTQRPEQVLALVGPFLDAARQGPPHPTPADGAVARPAGISYLHVPALDARRSAAFYAAVFGWPLRGGPDHPSFSDGTGHVIGSWDTTRPVAGDTGVLAYVYVESVDATLARVADAGGAVVTAPYPEGDLWVATFKDPAGSVLGMWQQGPR